MDYLQARIMATSKEEAVQTLRDALDSIDNEYTVLIYDDQGEQASAIEYMAVYFNPDHVTEDDITSE
jgi:hypothetical protein